MINQLTDASTLVEDYFAVRNLSVKLCQPLQTEDYVAQPVIDVSPPKWHLGHTTWFFETFILKAYQSDYKEFHPRYNYVFNSYYESVGERVLRIKRGDMTRPTVAEVYAYREYVDQAMKAFLESQTDLSERFLQVLELGLNHEQQHQELFLTDLKYTFGQNPLHPVYHDGKSTYQKASDLSEKFLKVEAGLYEVGFEGKDFHFDNEEGRHQVYLHAFQFQDRLITNGEYLEFIQSGAYQQFQHWHAEGWDWVKNNQIFAPRYWQEIEGEWYHFSLRGLEKINWEEPVTHISFYEASAYANWRGKRLLTEFEWEVACQQYNPKPPELANFVDDEHFHPIARQGDNLQLWGDVWEWTNSAYLPYPYFKAEEGAIGEYNGKFMVNQMVLRGGSCATSLNHIRMTYRNFFHPYLRWQFTGIRLAEYL